MNLAPYSKAILGSGFIVCRDGDDSMAQPILAEGGSVMPEGDQQEHGIRRIL